MSYFLDFGEFDLSYMVDLHVRVGEQQAGLIPFASSAKAAGMRALLLRPQEGSSTELSQQISAAAGALIIAGAFRPGAMALDAETFETALTQGAKLLDLSEQSDLLSKKGELHSILELIRDHNAILATGSLTEDETILLVEAAQQMDLRRILVPAARLPDLSSAGVPGSGVFFEWALAGLQYPADPIQMADLAGGIRQAGIEVNVISSGLEPGGAIDPVDALSHYLAALAAQGLSVRELKEMAKKTPAFLLDLPERFPKKPDK
jgi:hypothetical protein